MQQTNNTFLCGEMELSYKRNPEQFPHTIIQSSSEAVEFFRAIWPKDIELRESSYVVYLAANNKILGYQQVSSGGIQNTVVDYRLIFGAALQVAACSIFLCHNHPSGNLQPSHDDRRLTNDIQQAGKLLKIDLLDHIILTADGYKSFADSGLL